MDLRKIILQEINSTLETFYLIVSKGESFVWTQNRLAGWSFIPIEDLDSEDILRSRFKNYSDAQNVIDSFKRRGRVDLLKYEPKVITVDFVMNKRDYDFPINESSDFDWII